MDTLAELVQEYTDLGDPIVEHLQRLVASWGVLSDLCFADLLLFAPTRGRVDLFVALGQVRPTTSQTLHPEDLVGRLSGAHDRPLLARAWQLGSVVEGEVAIPRRGEHARLVCIPVRRQGRLVGLLTRESALVVGRRPGQLERVYVEVFDRLARMIAQGAFPYPVDEIVTAETPRVGDGVLVLDPSARVDYASPNAVSAIHRLGVRSGIEGIRLDEAGLDQAAVSLAYESRMPVTQEIGDGTDTSVALRCLPLLDNGAVTGALLLIHDVSELRRRDRLLLSKDAAIREVHHRVKNNLQTISSLLRLQSRRMAEGEPRSALEEAERRVRSIAIVHEILSRDTVDEVDFNDILPSLVRMAEDLGRVDRPVRVTCTGDAGQLHASVATPLAVVITELLQNAAEHGQPEQGAMPEGPPGPETSTAGGGAQDTDSASARGGKEEDPDGRAGRPLKVAVELRRTDGELRVTVRDNGVGLPPDFSIDDTSGLGLSIVRGLVRTQLGGVISMHGNGGAVVDVAIPLDRPTESLENL